MRKNKFVKKLVLFLSELLLVTSSFAINNDGSKFVTKTEFDALYSTFMNQINKYFVSIDTKIEEGIANYLNSIKAKTHMKTDGYIPSIARKGAKYTKFGYGNALSATTGNPSSTNMVNNYICLIYINNIGVQTDGWEMIQYLGHVPGNYSGEWENPTNGCNLVGFEKVTINDVDYLGLSDDAKVNKWQFQLSQVSSGVAISAGRLTASNDRTGTNTWDFTKDGNGENILKPSAFEVTEGIAGESLTCAKTVSNVVLSTTTNEKCNYGNYYYTSNSATLYGWLKDEYYVYDENTLKTETPKSTSQRRIRKNNADLSIANKNAGYIFKYYQPKTYTTNFNTLVNVGATEIVGEPIYCYNGLPIYSFPAHTRTVTIPLNVTSCGSSAVSQYKLYIAKKPFDNNLVSSTTLSSSDIVYKDTNYVSVGDRTIEFDLNNSERAILYLKLVPYSTGENYALEVKLQPNKQIEYDYE